jgi:hypothetical protein
MAGTSSHGCHTKMPHIDVVHWPNGLVDLVHYVSQKANTQK